MPWTTPTLRAVRELVRGEVSAKLAGASYVGNSVLRVMADAMAAVCHLTLRYLDWLALQLLPDTAEHEWLDRHGEIWLVNADGSIGRKMATLARGSVTMTGTPGIVVPAATQLGRTDGADFTYETLAEIIIGTAPTPVDIRALDPGYDGNLAAGDTLTFVAGVAGVDSVCTVVELTGGTDEETDEQLRSRILRRIQQPPQGGAAHDYEQWALAVPGCTRAWCVPLEMGIGTVTVRVLFDKFPGDPDPWPTAQDLDAVQAYLDKMRPVAVKDFWVLAPIKQFVDVSIAALEPDTPATRAAVEASVQDMLLHNAKPGQTIFATWKAQAVMNAAGVDSFVLRDWTDDVMASPGHMAVLGDILYAA